MRHILIFITISWTPAGRHLPDYCNGNLYALTPKVGLGLAEGARSTYHYFLAEDCYITGNNTTRDCLSQYWLSDMNWSCSRLGAGSHPWDKPAKPEPSRRLSSLGRSAVSLPSPGLPQIRFQPPGGQHGGGGRQHSVRQQSQICCLCGFRGLQLRVLTTSRALHGTSQPHLLSELNKTIQDTTKIIDIDRLWSPILWSSPAELNDCGEEEIYSFTW